MTESKEKVKDTIILVICGLSAGFLNGIFGGGGGMIVVPLLMISLHLSNIKAHATAILIIFIISIFSILIYGFNGGIDFKIEIPTMLGSILGGILGAKLLNALNPTIIAFIFISLMLFAGIRLVI